MSPSNSQFLKNIINQLNVISKEGYTSNLQIESSIDDSILTELVGGINHLLTTLYNEIELKKRFQLLVETTSDWVWEVDNKGVYTYCSSKVEDILGVSAEEALGKTPFDFMSPAEMERVGPVFQKLVANAEEIIELTNTTFRKDGTEIILETNGRPFFDENGELAGYRGMDRDITKRKALEKEHEKMQLELLNISRLSGMSEIATGVLHNVGNVLNSLNISAEVIGNKLINTASKELARTVPLIEKNLDNLGDYLVNDQKGKLLPQFLIQVNQDQVQENQLLKKEMTYLKESIEHIKDIVSVQQSLAGVSGVIQDVLLNELIDQAVQFNVVALERHGIKLYKEYQANITVQTDRLKVLQILINLISNAKYASSPAVNKEIIIRVKEINDHYIQIQVIDKGIGIEKENLSNIFQYGFTTKSNGHGFGLHNSALAAGELGGQLMVSSDGKNQGATFTLTIPKKHNGKCKQFLNT